MKIGLSQLPGRCPFRSNWRLPKRESVFSVVGGGVCVCLGFVLIVCLLHLGSLRPLMIMRGQGAIIIHLLARNHLC